MRFNFAQGFIAELKVRADATGLTTQYDTHRLVSMVRWLVQRNRAEQDLHDEVQAFVEMARGSAPGAPSRLRRHFPSDLLSIGLAAVTSGAPIVFLADILQKPDLIPVGAQRQLEILREGPGKDLWIVDRDLVLKLAAGALQAFDGVKRITMPAGLGRVGVVIVVQDPALEVDRINDQRVSLPLPD